MAALGPGSNPLGIAASLDDVAGCILTGEFLKNANAVLMLSAVFDRTLRKYGPRGYRYILLEAGHVAQSVGLLAAEAGLGALCIGGFWDAKLNDLLGLGPRREAIVYCVGVGHPAEDGA